MLPVITGVIAAQNLCRSFFGPIGKRESVTSRPIKFDHSRGVANESRLVGKFKRGMGEGENHETSPVFRGEGDRSQIEMQNHRKNEKTPVNFTCIFNFQFSNYFR